MATRQYPFGTHVLAVAQARAHANLANIIANSMGERRNPGEVLAFLVNAAFSIELYFKAFMLAGKNGEVTVGHDLSKLLQDFPPAFTHAFESAYAAHPNAREANVALIGLTLGLTPSKGPAPTTPMFSFATFEDAVASLSGVFVEARYYFEQLNPSDWSVIVYPRHAVAGVLSSLDSTYESYLAGTFANQGA